MNPTVLTTASSIRVLDVLDLAVMDAMLLAALGPNHDGMTILTRTPTLQVQLSPLGRATLLEMGATSDDVELDSWLELLSEPLVTEVLAQVGLQWRAEAESGVDFACAERSEDMPAVVAAAQHGPLVVDTTCTLAQLLAARVCDPGLVSYIV